MNDDEQKLWDEVVLSMMAQSKNSFDATSSANDIIEARRKAGKRTTTPTGSKAE